MLKKPKKSFHKKKNKNKKGPQYKFTGDFCIKEYFKKVLFYILLRTLAFLLIPKISLTHNLIHYTYMIDNILFFKKSQYFIFK